MHVNVRHLFGSGEYLRARRLFHSSAKSSTSINVIPTFHEERLRFCICHPPGRKTDANRTQTRRKTDTRRTLDERRRDARRTQMRRGCSDRLFLSSTVRVPCPKRYSVNEVVAAPGWENWGYKLSNEGNEKPLGGSGQFLKSRVPEMPFPAVGG